LEGRVEKKTEVRRENLEDRREKLEVRREKEGKDEREMCKV